MLELQGRPVLGQARARRQLCENFSNVLLSIAKKKIMPLKEARSSIQKSANSICRTFWGLQAVRFREIGEEGSVRRSRSEKRVLVVTMLAVSRPRAKQPLAPHSTHSDPTRMRPVTWVSGAPPLVAGPPCADCQSRSATSERAQNDDADVEAKRQTRNTNVRQRR